MNEINYKKWTPEEDSLLKSIYETNSKEFISSQFKKPWNSIKTRARKLELHRKDEVVLADRKIRYGPRSDAWTTDDDKLLREIYEHNTKKFILSKIDRTWKAIWGRAYEFNLHRDENIVKQEMVEAGKNAPPGEDVWTKEENELLKQIYEDNCKEFITEKLKNRTWKAIRERSTKLGLKRNEGVINEERIKVIRKTTMEKYGVESTWQLDSVKEKSKQTNMERRGVEYALQSPGVRQKIKETVQENYGVDNVFQADIIKQKAKQSFYKSGTQRCSKQQRYIATLLNGKLNFPIGNCNVDILIDDSTIIEYDGGGHCLQVKLGYLSRDEHIKLERKRDLYLKSKNFSIIRIISENDVLPEDSFLIKMISDAKEYLKKGHSWITYDIDNKKVLCSVYQTDYDFGKLREIKDA